MPRLPKRNTTRKKRGFAAKPGAAKKNLPPKKRLTLQERLKQKVNLAKRRGRDQRFITAKDIRLMLRCSAAKAYRWLKKIREQNGKPPRVPVTLHEWCTYTALSKESVTNFLDN